MTISSNLRLVTKHFLILIAFATLLCNSKYQNIFGDADVWFEIESFPDLDYIQFTALVPHNSYFAVGFGSSMTDTDMIMFQSNYDSSTVVDLWSTGHVMPQEDDSQDLSCTTYQLKNHMRIVSQRKFDTGDLKDYTFKRNSTINMIAAWVTTTYNLTYHGKNRASFAVQMDSIGNVTQYIESTQYDFFYTHGWVMWTSWGFLSFIQFASNRYLKMYWYVNMWIHRITGTIILGLTLAYGILAMQKAVVEFPPGGHTIFGFFVLFTVGFLVLYGVFTRSMMNRLTWKTKHIIRIKLIHKLLGYAVIWIAQVAILTGGIFYSSTSGNSNPFVIAHFCMYFIAFLFCESLYRKYKDLEMPYKEIENIISIEKFDQRVIDGENLVILDDLVLDVSRFKFNHPGGKFVLQQNIGRDISKYFYGGYSLENEKGGVHRYAHSNAARHVVNGLIVGRLEGRANTFSARIISKQDVNTNSKVIVLRSQGIDSLFKLPLSTDIQSFGKHILLRSFNDLRTKRHYTLTVCMKPPIYEEYIKAINQFKNGQEIEFNTLILQEYSIDEAEAIIVVKNYDKKGKLSVRLHTSEYETYQIKGLMGKGLNVNREGKHIAFVAGTGILPFLDFIAYLIRYNLDQLSQGEDAHLDRNNFQFVLYVSATRREEVIGIELIEGLQLITQRKGLRNFELITRYSDTQVYHWDDLYTKRQLEIHKGSKIEKIWVCGPPLMNEMFDKSLEKLSKEFNIKRSQIEIL